MPIDPSLIPYQNDPGGLIDSYLGVDAPAEPAQESQQPFSASGWEQFIEGLAHGLENQQQSRPRGFGGHFGAGLLAGLGSAGSRIAAKRAAFDAQQTERRKTTDAARLKDQERYRTERSTAMRGATKDRSAAASKQAEYERDNIVPNAEQLKAAPWLARVTDANGRVPRSTLDDAFKPSKSSDAEGPLVAIVGPDGKPVLVGRGEARGRTPFNPSTPGAKMPSATERAAITADANAVAQTQNIRKLYRKEFVGPVSGRRGEMGMAIGRGLKKGEAEFRGGLAIFRNAVINALSGAAVSESEAKRMKQQIPQETDPSEVFEAKLSQTENNLARLAEMRKSVFSDTGLDMSGLGGGPDLSKFVKAGK